MNTVLNIKLDPKLKKQAQEAAKALGLPISTVVAASLREFVRTRSITISDPPRLKPEVEAELLKISADAKKGSNISPAFDSLDESFVWLDKEVAKERKKIKKSA
jgi:addiction module RelB/DinJ family antitoxin